MLLSVKTGRVRETTPLRRLSHKFEKMKNREVIHRLHYIICFKKYIEQYLFGKEFFEKEVLGNPIKAEYLLPIFIGELLEQGKMSVKVLKTNDTWYGMTYHEDVAAVKDNFKKMLEKGVYKADLFSDL